MDSTVRNLAQHPRQLCESTRNPEIYRQTEEGEHTWSSLQVELNINYKKSNILIRDFTRNDLPEEGQKHEVEHRELVLRNRVKYLGICFTSQLSRKYTNNDTITAAYKAAEALLPFIDKNATKMNAHNINVYISTILPSMTYGVKGGAHIKANQQSIRHAIKNAMQLFANMADSNDDRCIRHLLHSSTIIDGTCTKVRNASNEGIRNTH